MTCGAAGSGASSVLMCGSGRRQPGLLSLPTGFFRWSWPCWTTPSPGVAFTDNVRNRLVRHDVQPIPLQADNGAAHVGQQHHVLDPEIEQDLRADTVIAQRARRPWATHNELAYTFGQRGLAVLAHQHDHTAPLPADHVHR